MKAFTDITLLIDRSGSMASCREAMEQALRTFVKGHKKVPSTRLSVIEFDDLDPQFPVMTARPIREVERISIVPRGNTPLIDAFCLAIDGAGNRLSNMKASERPDQVLFVVITDGQENASKRFKREDLVTRTRHQQDRYNWQFIYLGANQDSMKEAQGYGLYNIRTNVNWNPAPASVGAMANYLTSSTVNFASNNAGARGMSGGLNVTDEQRLEIDNPTNGSSVKASPKP